MTQESGAQDDHALQDLREAVDSLVRGGWEPFESVLVTHGIPAQLVDTKCFVRSHFIRSDPNGIPRVQALSRQLAKQIVQFCIPRSDVIAARSLSDDARDEEISRLTLHAQRLFTTTQKLTGEGGELLLFTLLERYLGIPQILSKMSLKTNTEVQIHGSDGVHAHFLEDDTLALYWGEAKIYDDLSSAVRSCFTSIGPFLRGEAASSQDVYLIQHFADAGDPRITGRLIDYFDDDNPLSASVEIRAGCLIGFPLEDYPSLPHRVADIQDAIDGQVADWSSKVASRIKSDKLAAFHIELFFVPVPSAVEFRKAVKTAMNLPA